VFQLRIEPLFESLVRWGRNLGIALVLSVQLDGG